MKRIVLLIVLAINLAAHGFSQTARNDHNEVLHQPPQVNFSWDGACFGDTTYFTNGTIRGQFYKWYIYDKYMNILDSSANFNISFYFPAADTFYVYLEADNGHIASFSQMLIIGNALSADFDFMHCSNQFLNHSTCATSFLWDFGDGATSTAQLPVHLYPDTGTYTVKMIAWQGALSDTVTKQIYVDPISFPTGVVTYYSSNDTLFVHSADSSAGLFYNWTFGDLSGHILDVQDTFHVYADTGIYILTLGVWNTCGQVNFTDTIHISGSINSMEKFYSASSISVFPNPVSVNEMLTISSNSVSNCILEVVVYNSTGEKVMSDSVHFKNGKGTMKISSLSQGMYIFSARSDRNVINSRFVIAEAK